MLVAHKIIRAQLTKAEAERDELRTKLERVGGLQRWELVSVECHGGYATVDEMHPSAMGDFVRWSELASIIGKDGEG